MCSYTNRQKIYRKKLYLFGNRLPWWVNPPHGKHSSHIKFLVYIETDHVNVTWSKEGTWKGLKIRVKSTALKQWCTVCWNQTVLRANLFFWVHNYTTGTSTLSYNDKLRSWATMPGKIKRKSLPCTKSNFTIEIHVKSINALIRLLQNLFGLNLAHLENKART